MHVKTFKWNYNVPDPYTYIQEQNRIVSRYLFWYNKHRLPSFGLEKIKKKRRNENSTWDQEDVKVEKFPLYVIVATHTVPRYRVLVVL